ncbi:uncharacterized protein [Watersipora subatra]|uniref:uncharacterized protein n=1 Tax=Watersipora subatra TaxID=2589382 RepID=UPI00355B649A
MAAIDWELDLAGDRRCDSPGHCALYGAYPLMDQSCCLIVSSHLVKSMETTSSNAMELEGFKRCQSDLISHGLSVRSITTDRHLSVGKYIREEWADVCHYYDAWHIVKGEDCRLSTEPGNKEPAGNWIKAIINHLWYSINHTDVSDEHEARWRQLLPHMRDDHRTKLDAWLSQELSSKRLINDLRKAGVQNTAELESFHKQLNHFAPNMVGFSYHGINSRLRLAGMYHNENATRSFKFDRLGNQQYVMARSKNNKLTQTAKRKKVNPTYASVALLNGSSGNTRGNYCEVPGFITRHSPEELRIPAQL